MIGHQQQESLRVGETGAKEADSILSDEIQSAWWIIAAGASLSVAPEARSQVADRWMLVKSSPWRNYEGLAAGFYDLAVARLDQ